MAPESAPHEFTVEETFSIAGRGLAVVGAGTSDLPVGRPLDAEIRTQDGGTVEKRAFREFVLIRATPAVEREAFLLVGTAKEEVPVGSTVRVTLP